MYTHVRVDYSFCFLLFWRVALFVHTPAYSWACSLALSRTQTYAHILASKINEAPARGEQEAETVAKA